MWNLDKLGPTTQVTPEDKDKEKWINQRLETRMICVRQTHYKPNVTTWHSPKRVNSDFSNVSAQFSAYIVCSSVLSLTYLKPHKTKKKYICKQEK